MVSSSLDLERREVLVPPAAEECVCPGCGEQRKPMGEEVSQRLELEPARRRHYPGRCAASSADTSFRGYSVVDGYKDHEALFGPTSPRLEGGCWMQAQQAQPCPEVRLCLRLAHSRPVHEELFGLLEEWAPLVVMQEEWARAAPPSEHSSS